MPASTIATIGLVLFGLIFGYFTSQSSIGRETIHGGFMAKLFNYIACCLWATVTPTVLVSLIVLDAEFLQAIALAIGMIFVAFVSLLAYAVFEKPAMAKLEQVDRGWTAEDAVSSGL